MQRAREAFGPHFDKSDFASLTGAPHDARVQVDHDTSYPNTVFRVSVSGPGLAADRTISRLGKKKSIYADFIRLENTGTGAGLKIFASQVENATKLGFSSIRNEAARSSTYNGYYTWARLGYNAKLGHAIRDRLPSNLKGARSIHALFKTEAGRSWWKENGTSLNMRFNLNPGSRSQRVLAAYLKEKGV
jgi:hypothetical protein